MITLHNNSDIKNSDIKKKLLVTLIVLTIILLSTYSTLATIDVASPENNYLTNENTIDFSAYITPMKDNCSLMIDGTIIQTIQSAQGLISFEASPDDGSYPWQISCYQSREEESTTTRFITIDRTAPIINISNPIENQTYSNIPLEFEVEDYSTTTCEVSLGDELLMTTNDSSINETLNPQTISSGNYSLNITCKDELNNSNTKLINITYEQPLQPLFLTLETDSSTYNLGQTATLTINSTSDSEVEMEICPDEEGFVQCYTPLIDNDYPQTINLPTDKAGLYLVEGRALREGEQITQTTNYSIENNMAVEITTDKTPILDREVTLTATASNGIGSYTYNWTLENGSTSQEQSITKTYDKLGTITDKVRVTDEEGNIVEENYTVKIEPLFQLKIYVQSAGSPLENATVQVDEEETMKTTSDGEAIIDVVKGEHEIYVSKEGYNFYFEKHEINESTDLEIDLLEEDKQSPIIKVLSPLGDKEVSTKFGVKYNVTDANIKNCTLLLDNGASGWFTEQETMPLTKSGEYSFKEVIFTNEKYGFKIECEDQTGNKAVTDEILLNINPELGVETSNATSKKVDYGAGLEDIDSAIDYTYGLLDSLSERETKAIEYLGLKEDIDLKNRDLNRILRDINDLQYRRDLDSEGKAAEKQKLLDQASAIISDLPTNIKVLNSKTFVKYLKEDDLLAFAERYIAAKNMNLKPNTLVKYLLPLQQKFTSETTAMNVRITKETGDEDYTLFVYNMKYANLENNSYSLLFEIPPEIAKNSRKLLSKNDFDLISEENPLMLQTSLENQTVFYVKQQLDLSKASQINQVLYAPISKNSNGITGAVIGISVDWKLSLMISLAIIAILFLIAKLNDRIRYIFYEFGSKKQTHYLRVLADDAITNLEAGNYEQANMIYEELKLAYEQEENELVKNDVYEDVIKVCRDLDEQYLLQLSNKIGVALQNNDLESAIDDFEKLEGTYERLTDEQKTTVEDLVTTIASKLGMV